MTNSSNYILKRVDQKSLLTGAEGIKTVFARLQAPYTEYADKNLNRSQTGGEAPNFFFYQNMSACFGDLEICASPAATYEVFEEFCEKMGFDDRILKILDKSYNVLNARKAASGEEVTEEESVDWTEEAEKEQWVYEIEDYFYDEAYKIGFAAVNEIRLADGQNARINIFYNALRQARELSEISMGDFLTASGIADKKQTTIKKHIDSLLQPTRFLAKQMTTAFFGQEFTASEEGEFLITAIASNKLIPAKKTPNKAGRIKPDPDSFAAGLSKESPIPLREFNRALLETEHLPHGKLVTPHNLLRQITDVEQLSGADCRLFEKFLIEKLQSSPDEVIDESGTTVKDVLDNTGRIVCRKSKIFIAQESKTYWAKEYATQIARINRAEGFTITEILEEFGLENNNANQDILEKKFHELEAQAKKALASDLKTKKEIKIGDLVHKGRRDGHSRILFDPAIVGKDSEFALVTREEILAKRGIQFTRNNAWKDLEDSKGNKLIAPAEFIREHHPYMKHRMQKAQEMSLELQEWVEEKPDLVVSKKPKMTLSQAIQFIETEEYGLVAFFSPLAEPHILKNYNRDLSGGEHTFIKGDDVVHLLHVPKQKGNSTYPRTAVNELLEEIFEAQKPAFANTPEGEVAISDFLVDGRKHRSSGYYIRKDVLQESDPPILTKEMVEARIDEIYLREHPKMSLDEAIQALKGPGSKVTANDRKDVSEFILARIKDKPSAIKEHIELGTTSKKTEAIQSVGSEAIQYLKQYLYLSLPTEKVSWMAGAAGAEELHVSKKYIISFNKLVRELWLKDPESEIKLTDSESIKVKDLVGHFKRGNAIGLLISPNCPNKVITERQVKVYHEGTQDVTTKLPAERSHWISGAWNLTAELQLPRDKEHRDAILEILGARYTERFDTKVAFNGKLRDLSEHLDSHTTGGPAALTIDPQIIGEDVKPVILSADLVRKQVAANREQNLPDKESVSPQDSSRTKPKIVDSKIRPRKRVETSDQSDLAIVS